MFRSVQRLFFWLSGAGTETLEQCPNWERRKYVAFGATVLVPCAFAFIACAYALSTLTDKASVIYPVAAVWAFIILTIDRALLAGYRPFLSWSRKLSQFGLRLFVAILMGLTIAHPLVLLLFRDTITSVIEEDRAAEIEEVRAVFDETKGEVQDRIDGLETSIAGLQDKWKETFQAKFIIQDREDANAALPGLTAEQQQELDAAISEATSPFRTRLDLITTQIDELTPQLAEAQNQLTFWQTEYERELNGQRSGLAGEGPRARSIKADQLEPRREEAKRLAGLLEHLTTEKSNLETQSREAEKAAIAKFDGRLAEIEAANKAEADRVAALKRRVEEDQAEAFTEQQNGLRESIKAQIDTRNEELAVVQQELADVTAEERDRINAIREEPRRDVLTQTLALHELFENGQEGGKFAFYTYCILTALFMLVDTIPLVVKFFTKPGPYDRLLDRDELDFEAQHKAFKETHGRYMEKLTSGNLTAVTRNKSLEHALVDGVEHSRAAREFLDSLIAMERSFAEQMKLEKEAHAASGPEKIAMLDQMKKKFYDDLHQRMEDFFSARHPINQQAGT